MDLDQAIRARGLADQMTAWLAGTGVGNDIYRLVVAGSAHKDEAADLYAADLIEWCRAARDILDTISPPRDVADVAADVAANLARCRCGHLNALHFPGGCHAAAPGGECPCPVTAVSMPTARP